METETKKEEEKSGCCDYFGKFVAEFDSVISAKTGVIDEPAGNSGHDYAGEIFLMCCHTHPAASTW